MIERLRITVLADNYVAVPGFLAEHGLSLLIEADGQRVLFDTGQGRVFRDNAKALGISLAGLDAVVLSHGHYDHTGGLAGLLREAIPSAVFLHPAATEPKYIAGKGRPRRSIGMPESSLQALQAIKKRVIWTRAATEIVPGLWCTGQIPRQPGNDQAVTGFFLDPEGSLPDPMADDQALYLNTAQGLVIIAGCTHSGIVNTLDHVCTLAGRDQVHALAGGFHLGQATDGQLEASAAAITRRRCRILAPCHCTGMGAHAHLRARFPSLVRDVGAGGSLAFD